MTNTSNGFETGGSAQAFELLKEEILRRGQSARTPTADIVTAAQAMIATHARVKPVLQEIREALPRTNIELIQQLGACGEALLYAQSLYSAAESRTPTVARTAARVFEERRVLITEYSLAVMRGVLREDEVRLSGSSSHRDAARDIRAIGALFLANWSRVEPAIGGVLARVEDAMALAHKLTCEAARSGQRNKKLNLHAQARNGAFDLGLAAQREAQRAVEYLRFYQADSSRYLVSVFGGGRPRKQPMNGSRAVRRRGEEAVAAGHPAEGLLQASERVAFDWLAVGEDHLVDGPGEQGASAACSGGRGL